MRILAVLLIAQLVAATLFCSHVVGNSAPSARAPSPATHWAEQSAASQRAKERALAQQALEQAQFAKDLEHMFTQEMSRRSAQGHTGIVGLYVKELYSGNAYYCVKSHRGEAQGPFEAASTVKLLTALAVYKKASRGEIDLRNNVTDKLLSYRGEVDWTARRMLTHSVNEYNNLLLRWLGVAEVNAVLEEAGLYNTVMRREIMPSPEATPQALLERYNTLEPNTTTPEDFGRLLELLYKGEFLGPELSLSLLRTLQNTIYNSRIPQGIGFEVPVAHKTGTAPGVTNDAALVCLRGNPYIIVIMTKDAYSGTTDFHRHMAKAVHSYMKDRSNHYAVNRAYRSVSDR